MWSKQKISLSYQCNTVNEETASHGDWRGIFENMTREKINKAGNKTLFFSSPLCDCLNLHINKELDKTVIGNLYSLLLVDYDD